MKKVNKSENEKDKENKEFDKELNSDPKQAENEEIVNLDPQEPVKEDQKLSLEEEKIIIPPQKKHPIIIADDSDDDSESSEEPDNGPSYILSDPVSLIEPPPEILNIKREKLVMVVEFKKEEGSDISMVSHCFGGNTTLVKYP